MRPWLAYVGVGVVAAMVVGGLGVGRRAASKLSPEPLSGAQFVSAADGTCYRAATKFSPTSLDKPYTTSLRTNLPVWEQLRSALSALKPPQNDAASFQLMLTTFDRSLRADRDLLRFDGTDLLRFNQAAMRQSATWDRLRTLSAKLGLGWCRWVWTWHPKNPSP